METSVDDYAISCDDIKEIEVIVAASRHRIYKGLWRHQLVCVKEIKSEEGISNELHILSKCIHPKIVQFLGADTRYHKTSIVFEHMENGTLREYMQNTKLSNHTKITMMIDILIGINYLHNRDPHIILHRDLKPENILVNKHGQVKICDFGISKLVVHGECTEVTGHTGETGSYIWMSPEVLKHEPYNFKSDMYSLGLIFYFIWTEKIPFAELNMNTIQVMFAKYGHKLPPCETDHPPLNTIINRCCSYQSESRPTSSELITDFEALLKTMYHVACHTDG